MKGSTYKRCKCRDADGKELGAACPKLRRRDGSWNPKHGTWYGKSELPPAPDGKRVYLRARGFPSLDELTEWFSQAERLLSIPDKGPRGHQARMEIRALIMETRKRGAPLPDYDDLRQRYLKGAALTSVLTGDYLEQWLAGKRDVRANTLRGYESHIRVHLRPALGHIPLDELRVSDIDALFAAIGARNERIAAGTEEGRPTGPATQQRILATLKNALQDALREGLISHNPAKLVRLGPEKRAKALVWTPDRVKAWRARYEEELGGRSAGAFKVWRDPKLRPSPVMVWTPEQTGVFLERARGHRLYAMFRLIAMTGLRRGEACGLEWADVDLDKQALVVRNQIVQMGWETGEGDPKTDASHAPVAFDVDTARALREHRKRQLADRLAWGDAWVETGKVFTRENGAALHPAQVTDQFERLAFEAGLPPIRLHDLRHGAATLALAAGVDVKVVSAMLRHSTTGITQDLYSSVLPEVAASAADAIAALVSSRGKGRTAARN